MVTVILYLQEEINWSYTEFVDIQDALDLIDKVFYSCFTLFHSIISFI